MDDAAATDCELQGLGVLVTRAAHQAAPLCRLIGAHGGRAIPFPALEITGPRDRAGALRLLAGTFDIMIFISPNAVHRGLPLLPGGRPPAGTRVAAVGRGSARALAAAGVPVALVPGGRYDSEALLALPALARLEGKRVLIVRGEGGRALLGETLAARGAQVRYAEVYRRRCPRADAAPLVARWRQEVALVTATSNAILENLFQLLGGRGAGLLRETPLLVVSPRMRERARALGCRRLLLARRADDKAILEAICDWHAGSRAGTGGTHAGRG
ncbi:MAG TPA: uroporphyrinogen-III synthase [Sedimenticola sp.]|nr:uroporphyrinogen-III synthase [Sedimenticola sp.]